MNGLTRSRLTRRGALVGLGPDTSKASVVAFQYHPDEMTQTLQARAASAGASISTGARNEALRLTGAPIENITLTAEIDAADQFGSCDPMASSLGIYLSSLEILLYPFVLVAQNRYAGAAGVIRDAFGSAGVTVNVISTADPITEVTTRQTNGLTVDGILTDEHFATLAGLADFIEMVPL